MNKKTVLIVEDDYDLRRMYEMQIEKTGYTVETAENGEEGITKVKDLGPDLVILDLMIPKKNGFEVLKQIKKSPKTKEIPVIVLSSLGQHGDIKLVKELGAIDYLIKSRTSLKKLAEEVTAALNKT